jgi:hypothetical protein
MTQMQPAIPVLERLLKDADPDVRREAQSTLALFRDYIAANKRYAPFWLNNLLSREPVDERCFEDERSRRHSAHRIWLAVRHPEVKIDKKLDAIALLNRCGNPGVTRLRDLRNHSNQLIRDCVAQELQW